MFIAWKDHVSNDEWLASKEEAKKNTDVAVIHTVGFLDHEDKESYVVSQSIAKDGSRTMVMRILKGTVLDFRYISK